MRQTTQTVPVWAGIRAAAGDATPVALLVEGGRRGHAAVEHAVALAAREPIAAVLVAVIPYAENSGCTMSAAPLNEAVRAAAQADLERAAAKLAPVAATTRRVILRDHVDAPLSDWATAHGIELILLPGRARPLRTRPHHPLARALTQTDAVVRIV